MSTGVVRPMRNGAPSNETVAAPVVSPSAAATVPPPCPSRMSNLVEASTAAGNVWLPCLKVATRVRAPLGLQGGLDQRRRWKLTRFRVWKDRTASCAVTSALAPVAPPVQLRVGNGQLDQLTGIHPGCTFVRKLRIPSSKRISSVRLCDSCGRSISPTVAAEERSLSPLTVGNLKEARCPRQKKCHVGRC